MEALTNNQLKMYLKQRGLKISGSMADFTERVVSGHARGNASRDVLEDEEFNNSCEYDTISESESSDSDGENSDVEESFEVLFVPEEDILHSSYIVGGTKAFFQNALLPNPTIYLLSI